MFKKIGYGLAVLAGLYLALALALTYWPAPRFQRPPPPRPAMQEVAYQPRSFTVRDGVRLYGRQFGGPAATTVLLIHGVGSDGSELERPAQLLHEASGARIVVLDLRGHGRSGGRRWSVDHTGQYDEDVSDVLAALRKEAPTGRLVLAGHSMGGGIALRHAVAGDGAPVDGYLLIAPLLGSPSPTMKTGGSGAGAGDRFLLFRTPRLIGVLLFDLIDVHAFDQLPIMELNQAGLPAYGFAALQSMQPNAPKDYRVALAAIRAPLLLVAGSRDEAFNASAYPGVIRAYSHGETMIAPGATHDGVLTQPDAVQKMGQWLRGDNPRSGGLIPPKPSNPKPSKSRRPTMSFREKRALIALLALWIVVIGYIAHALHLPPDSIPAAIPGMVAALALLIGIMIVSHIALVIGVGAKEARQPSDERERLIQLASRRNVSWVCQVGLWLILMLAVTARPHVVIAQAALGAFILAEIVMYASELFYSRRGV